MAVNGFSLEVTANVDGFNRKLAEARKSLEKLKKEATININGSAGAGAGTGSATATTAQRKATAGLLSMSSALDSATRALVRFGSALGASRVKTSIAASGMAAATRGGAKESKAGLGAMALGVLPTAAVLGAAAGVPIYKGLQEYGAREKLRTDLGTLMRSDEGGANMALRLQRYAGSTPYSQNDLAGTAKMLLQYGAGADETERLIKQLGDVALGNGQAMSSLGLVLGQVKSAGALKGQDLMQFINAGFNPLAVLSEMTGESMADLKDAASEGKITFDMVAAALEHATSAGGQFYKGAERGSKTLQGLASTISDNIGTALAQIVENNEGPLKSIAESWAKFDWSGVVQSGSELFKTFINWVSRLSDVMQFFAKHSAVTVEAFKALGAAVAGVALTEGIYKVREMITAFSEAGAGVETFSGQMKVFSKSMVGQAALLAASIWAVGKIAEATGLVGDLIEQEAKAGSREKHYGDFNEAMGKVKLYQGRQDQLGLNSQEIAQARERMKSLPRGVDFSKIDFKSAGQYFSGLNENQIQWVSNEFERQTWLKKAMDANKATAAVDAAKGAAGFDDYMKQAMRGAKGAQTIVIDKSKKEVKQTNNIKVDESRFMKVVKDNLEMLLTSHFRIDSDLTGMQANAG